MDRDFGNWQEEGPEDIHLTAGVVDPLLELAGELALCYEAVDSRRGSFCSNCTCQLGYHLTCEDGVCELCECEETAWLCVSCGKSRVLEMYPVGKDGQTKTCKFCLDNPPIKILPDLTKRRSGTNSLIQAHIWEGITERQERAKSARMVLAELSD